MAPVARSRRSAVGPAERARRADPQQRGREPAHRAVLHSAQEAHTTRPSRVFRRRPGSAATLSGLELGRSGRRGRVGSRRRDRRPRAFGPCDATRRGEAAASVVCPARRGGDTTQPTGSAPHRRGRGRRRPRRAASGCRRVAAAGGVGQRGAGSDVATFRRDQPRRHRAPEGRTSDSAGRLKLRDDPGNATRSASGNQLERLLIVECLDRSRQPDRNVIRLDHTG
jgi:hypothetical protein